MKLYKTETDNILFTGDLHGDFEAINVAINGNDLDNCGIIFCGDIGLGFEKEEHYRLKFNHLTKNLKKRNIHLYFFRGNHDSKSFFDGEHFTEFEYIHVIPDYSVIQTPAGNILCVGGAISIDRNWRLSQMELYAVRYARYHSCTMDEARKLCKQLYWEDEANVYDEKELSNLDELNIKIDTVCTHSCPSFCCPITKDGIKEWTEYDEELEKDLNNERKACDMLLEFLKSHGHPIASWYYGHFHFHNTEIIDNIKYTLLDMVREKMDLV